MAAPSLAQHRSLTYRDAILPLLLSIAAGFGAFALMRPFLLQMMRSQLSAEQAARLDSSAQTGLLVVGAIQSLILPMILIAFIAGLAYATLSLVMLGSNRKVAYSALFATVAWAFLALIAKQIVVAGLLLRRGVESVRTPEDLMVATGLGPAFGDMHSLLYHLGELVNVFDLGYLALVVWLLERHERLPTGAGFAAAAVPWALVSLLRIAWTWLFVIPRL